MGLFFSFLIAVSQSKSPRRHAKASRSTPMAALFFVQRARADIEPPEPEGPALPSSPAFLHRVPEAGYARYPDRRANDSHTPPPISATPDSRPSHRAGARFRNNFRLAPAAIAQPASVTTAIATEMMHITAS